jgi:hypothetical protein
MDLNISINFRMCIANSALPKSAESTASKIARVFSLLLQHWQHILWLASVTAPILRVPEEGTLGAKKHLEAHLDKLLEGGGVKVTPLVGFRLLSHPLSHSGV